MFCYSYCYRKCFTNGHNIADECELLWRRQRNGYRNGEWGFRLLQLRMVAIGWGSINCGQPLRQYLFMHGNRFTQLRVDESNYHNTTCSAYSHIRTNQCKLFWWYHRLSKRYANGRYYLVQLRVEPLRRQPGDSKRTGGRDLYL